VRHFYPFKLVDFEEEVEKALSEDFNVKVKKLHETESLSQFLVFIKGSEEPHYHAEHDLTFVVLKGEGVLYLDGREERLKERDSAFIPRKAVHYYRNDSPLSVLLATFAPPYDGKDSVKVR